MDRRNQPAEFWGQSFAFWCRLWQSQIEYSMRFWGALAERMPHPSAAELSAEAEAMRDICNERPTQPQRTKSAPSRSRAQARAPQHVH